MKGMKRKSLFFVCLDIVVSVFINDNVNCMLSTP